MHMDLVFSRIPLSPYSTKTRVCVGYPMELSEHKQHELYMANVSPNARGPNATYIPPAHVGGRVG